MIQAGKLRHRVTVEQFTSELDTDGEEVGGWMAVFDRPISAEIHPLSGRELMAADAAQSKVNTRIIVRFRTEFRASMRVLHRSTIYNIEAVIPDPDSGTRYATLMCTSGINEG